MSKNIYTLMHEYNRLRSESSRSKFFASLDYDTRNTLQNFMKFCDNSERFETIYDGWIENKDDELVLLEVYSVILKTKQNLESICVDDNTYNKFIEHKKSMLNLLLGNKQYYEAKSLLSLEMHSESFKEKKLEELKDKALQHLKEKKIALHKKVLNVLYEWVADRKLPVYLVSEFEGDFKFDIYSEYQEVENLQSFVEIELKKSKLQQIVDKLV